MTPPPVATQFAETALTVDRRSGPIATNLFARLLDSRSWRRIRGLSDLIVLYLAASAALLADPAVRAVPVNGWLAAAFPPMVMAILVARRSPDDRLRASRLDTWSHVVGVISLAAILTVALDAILGGDSPVGLALRLWLFAGVYLSIERLVLLSLRTQAMHIEALATPTLIVGAGRVGDLLVQRLLDEPVYGLRPVGFIDSDPLPHSRRTESPFVPVLGGIGDLDRAIAHTGARRLILAFSTEPDQVLVDKVAHCQAQGIEVSLVPRLYETINERASLDHVGGLPLLTLSHTNPRGWQFAVKHTIDRGFAALAILALAPVWLLIALGVKLSSPGRVLFRQRRVGRDGRAFDLLKFRTMRETRDDGAFEPPEGCAPGGVEGADRRTRFGRILRETSLDELPQLLNVLRGEMSLVGPRPERPEFVERFCLEVTRYDNRHRVKSGITGWAQVNGLRGQTSIADRVEWDNYYIRNWSLRFDLKIIALTIAEVLRFRE